MNNNKIPRRRSIRLKDYDYSDPGAYFITICTQDHKCLFGKIINDKMILNKSGEMIRLQWQKLKERFKNIYLDSNIVMPNHFHGILTVGAPFMGARFASEQKPAPTICEIVGAFKSLTTKEYINGIKNLNWISFEKKLWQRNYYEHIIRDNKSLSLIQNYIETNPENWKKDKLFKE